MIGEEGNAHIWVMNDDGTGASQLTSDPNGYDGEPAWSPDGSKIAFWRQMNSPPYTTRVYVMDADGSNVTQVTNGPNDASPTWSPDGTRIVFSRYTPATASDLYVVDADGSNLTQLTSGTYFDSGPDWSVNDQIVFMSDRDAPGSGYLELYVMNSDGSSQTRITTTAGSEQNPDWSPDGTRIVFELLGTAVNGMYVMDADGSNYTQLTNYGQAGSWSPDGSQIAFEGINGWDIIVMNADGTNQTNITNNANTPSEGAPAWGSVAFVDTDGDGVADEGDNCPATPNPDQTDTDGTGGGNACDLDDDGDGIADTIDASPLTVSDRFSDVPLGGGTAGRIVGVPVNTTFVLEDLPAPNGIRVVLTATGPVPGGDRFRIQLDGKGTTLRFSVPGTYTVTDPTTDTTVGVVVGGPAEITFQVGGVPYVVAIAVGSSATITETTNEAGALEDVSVKDVTGAPGGVTINGQPVEPGSDPVEVASMDGTFTIVRPGRFEFQGTWSSSAAGIDPLSQDVTLTFLSETYLVSAGRMRQKGTAFVFSGSPADARDVKLNLVLQPTGPGTWSVVASGGPVQGLWPQMLLAVSLRIGGVIGTTTLRAQR